MYFWRDQAMIPAGWRPELAIFDCDGVLIDSEVISATTLLGLLRPYDLGIGIEHVQRHFLGRSFPTVAASIRQQFDLSLPADFESEYRRLLLSNFETSLRPTAGVIDVLDRLATPSCVATSSSPQRAARSLEIAGLDGYFDKRIYTASQVECGKPAPDLFLHVAKCERADPAKCLVIEDSLPGIEAALAAGMQVLRYVGASHFDAARTIDGGDIAVFDNWLDIFDMVPLLETRAAEKAGNGDKG